MPAKLHTHQVVVAADIAYSSWEDVEKSIRKIIRSTQENISKKEDKNSDINI